MAGASLSLSGALGLQGREAERGLQFWCADVNERGGLDLGSAVSRRTLRLVVRDDASRLRRMEENVRTLLSRDGADALFGPYGSHLTRAVAPFVASRGKVLWNHGGASDAIGEGGWRTVVSVPSPASEYFRALPAFARREDRTACRLAVVHADRGSFAPEVARGVVAAAQVADFDVIHIVTFTSPLLDAQRPLREALEAEPSLLVGVGSFQDDVALARQRSLLSGVRVLAFVGAGLDAFARDAGEAAEGVIGPSQWEPTLAEPPRTGPDAGWFSAEFTRRFGERPGYPGAQAFAIGVVFEACARTARSLEDGALLAAARALETTTLYGGFRLDPATGRQVGHRSVLVRWRAGRKVVLPASGGPGVG